MHTSKPWYLTILLGRVDKDFGFMVRDIQYHTVIEVFVFVLVSSDEISLLVSVSYVGIGCEVDVLLGVKSC
jgi:hypothetical protein